MKIPEKQRRCLEIVLNNFAEEIIKREYPNIPYEKVNVVLDTSELHRYSIIAMTAGSYFAKDMTIRLVDNPNNSIFFHELMHHIQYIRANKDYNKAFPEIPGPYHEQKYEIEADQESIILWHKYNKMIQKERKECYKL